MSSAAHRMSSATHRCDCLVAWSVEEGGILVVDEARGPIFLPYPQAAIWDFVIRAVPKNRAIAMLAAIAATSEKEAERLYAETRDEWLRALWIEERRQDAEPIDHA